MLVAIVGVDIPRVPWTGPLAPGGGAGWADDVGPHGQAGAGHTPSRRLEQPNLQAVGQGGKMESVHMARLEFSWPYPQ